MRLTSNKATYQTPNLQIRAVDEQDVVRTSNGAELNYQEQNGWNSGNGYDKPFGVN